MEYECDKQDRRRQTVSQEVTPTSLIQISLQQISRYIIYIIYTAYDDLKY